LKKRPQVLKALEQEYDESDLKKLNQAMSKIQAQMEICKEILGLNEAG
jgi:hypothetical protein